MLLALTGYEIGLMLVAAAFIVFALVVALVIPRSRPDFPARKGLGIFVAVCLVFFVAQMTAVVALAELGEEEHAEVAETEPGETEPTETEPGETEPSETEPSETEPAETETNEETEPVDSGGDPAAGKEVFASAGCGSCHTFADAGSAGTIGPNLDASTPSFELAVDRVTNGQGAMPSFSDSLSEEQIQDVAAYVSSAAGG